MAFNVEEFKSALEFGGARPTLFQVFCNFPGEVVDGVESIRKVGFLGRAAALPESNIGVIALPYFGRVLKFAGDREFQAWSLTVINDEDFTVRNSLEDWHQQLNDRIENVRNPNFVRAAAGGTQNYKQNIDIVQYGQDGRELRSYTLIGAFPAAIERINLDWGLQNRIEEFNVTFVYDYWNVNQTA